MSRSERLWRGIEEVGGPLATIAWWEARCGAAGLAAIRGSLVETRELAEWLPDPGDPGRQMRVIPDPRRRGGLLAISEEEPRRPDIPLAREALALHRLEIAGLGRLVARALGMPAARISRPISASAVRIGEIPSHGLTMFLVVCFTPEETSYAFDVIRRRHGDGVAIVTPTARLIPAHLRRAIDDGVLQHAELAELIDLRPGGELVAACDPATHFSPAPGIQEGPPYKTWPLGRPPNPSWSDVEIVMGERDTAWIRFGEANRSFCASEIVGLCKGSSGGKHNHAWVMLCGLAARGGLSSTPTDQDEQDRVRQTRKQLRDVLRRFFGIPGDPFRENRRKRVWAALFSVREK